MYLLNFTINPQQNFIEHIQIKLNIHNIYFIHVLFKSNQN